VFAYTGELPAIAITSARTKVLDLWRDIGKEPELYHGVWRLANQFARGLRRESFDDRGAHRLELPGPQDRLSMPAQHTRRLIVALAAAVITIGIFAPPAAAFAKPLSKPATKPARTEVASVVSRPHREVFGYVNAGNLASPTVGYATWNFDDLSTVALFGLHQNTDGSFALDRGWQVWNSADLAGLVTTAHAHGVKVVPSIVFHDSSSTNGGATWTPMCEVLTPNATSHTVSDIMSEITAKGADGFNLNYEGNNQLCPNGQYQAQMLVALMQLARLYMPTAYISISTYNASYYPGYFFDLPHLNPYVDSFFVMDYDSTWSNYPALPLHCAVYCFSPNGPLVRYDYNDTGSVQGYLGVVPASKVIVGVPYYGKTACIPGSTRPGPNAVPYTDSRAHWATPRYLDSSTTNGQAGVYYFQTNYDPYSPTDSYSTWWDGDWSCWRESYWDNVVALGAKYDLVNANNLRGVGIFTLDYGGPAPELWNLLQNKFVGCTSAALTPAPGSLPVGGTATLTASSTGCPNPLYEFWTRKSGGTWSLAQAYSSSALFNWTTTGLVPGAYEVAVWARQTGTANGPYDAAGGGVYTLAGCSAATVTPAPGSFSLPAPITFTATASGCPNPEYEYWTRRAGGVWATVQPYSTNPSFTWTTAKLAPGGYEVAVWVRQHGSGSPGGYDVAGGGAYTIIGCSSASVSPVAGTRLSVGGTMTFTANAAGCSNPEFAFWVRPKGGFWLEQQPYSSSATFNWNTVGLMPGTFEIAVWARQQGATGVPYNVSTGGLYPVGGCASATLTPAPGSNLAAGSVVTFTASSTGCTNPQYALWVRRTGSTWVQVRGYGTSATITWNTAGWSTGSYEIALWARQAGSGSGSYDVSGGGAYALG
jgi:spore germination protein YaaH